MGITFLAEMLNQIFLQTYIKLFDYIVYPLKKRKFGWHGASVLFLCSGKILKNQFSLMPFSFFYH